MIEQTSSLVSGLEKTATGTHKMLKTVCTRKLCLVCLPLSGWSQRGTWGPLKCSLQSLLTGVHELRSVHTWFDSQVREQPKHTVTALLACRSFPHLVHVTDTSWQLTLFSIPKVKTALRGERLWGQGGYQEECDRPLGQMQFLWSPWMTVLSSC